MCFSLVFLGIHRGLAGSIWCLDTFSTSCPYSSRLGSCLKSSLQQRHASQVFTISIYTYSPMHETTILFYPLYCCSIHHETQITKGQGIVLSHQNWLFFKSAKYGAPIFLWYVGLIVWSHCATEAWWRRVLFRNQTFVFEVVGKVCKLRRRRDVCHTSVHTTQWEILTIFGLIKVNKIVGSKGRQFFS